MKILKISVYFLKKNILWALWKFLLLQKNLCELRQILSCKLVFFFLNFQPIKVSNSVKIQTRSEHFHYFDINLEPLKVLNSFYKFSIILLWISLRIFHYPFLNLEPLKVSSSFYDFFIILLYISSRLKFWTRATNRLLNFSEL